MACFSEWVYQLLQIQVGQWAQKVGDWHAECAQRLDGEPTTFLLPVLVKEGRRGSVIRLQFELGIVAGSHALITWNSCCRGDGSPPSTGDLVPGELISRLQGGEQGGRRYQRRRSSSLRCA